MISHDTDKKFSQKIVLFQKKRLKNAIFPFNEKGDFFVIRKT